MFTQIESNKSSNGNLKERENIPDELKWDLTALYENKKAWELAKEQLKKDIDQIKKFEGTLNRSAENLYECLELKSWLENKFLRLSSYASRLYDQDTRQSEPQAMTQTMNQLGTNLSSAESFIEPEILTIEKSTITAFMEKKPELKVYSHYLDDIQRTKEHTLSSSEEKIISQTGLMSGTPNDIYSIFKNADMPRSQVTIDGEEVWLDDSAYSLHRTNSDRNVRKEVFKKFFGVYSDFERTIGTQLASQINRDLFYKNVRGYDSCLEHSLDGNNIPTSVYHNLIESVHQNLPVLHRYLNLRESLLDVDKLHYYDLYPPLVPDVDLQYEVDEAQTLIKSALHPLGDRYVGTLDQAFTDRWIDMMPNTGKRSGAYSAGSVHDVHPFILVNFNGLYTDVSTLAHELGHTMHSYYSNKNQHYINAHYPIFLAEVASITNEGLLMDHMLSSIDDPQQRLSILGDRLESFRGTLFRQTQFAEFELKIHERAESGEALTGESLTQLYLDILKKYYGHDEGIMVIEDLYGIEWAYIPHFYYHFYVYQYATSFCAATAVTEAILSDGQNMQDQYIESFLGAGGSDYPIPILKNIGIDMTTTEPYNLAFRKMDETIDAIEEILADTEG